MFQFVCVCQSMPLCACVHSCVDVRVILLCTSFFMHIGRSFDVNVLMSFDALVLQACAHVCVCVCAHARGCAYVRAYVHLVVELRASMCFCVYYLCDVFLLFGLSLLTAACLSGPLRAHVHVLGACAFFTQKGA